MPIGRAAGGVGVRLRAAAGSAASLPRQALAARAGGDYRLSYARSGRRCSPRSATGRRRRRPSRTAGGRSRSPSPPSAPPRPRRMTTPALSVVLTTRTGWGPVDATVRCLAAQTVADRIELVLVSFSPSRPATPPPELARLGSHRVVRAPGRRLGRGGQRGGRARRAPPLSSRSARTTRSRSPSGRRRCSRATRSRGRSSGPSCATRTRARRRAGPTSCSATRRSPRGRTAGRPARARATTPPTSATCSNATPTASWTAMAAEWLFHGRLRAQGERVYLEPRAITRHVNFACAAGLPRREVQGGALGATRGAGAGVAVAAAAGLRRRARRILPALRWGRLLRGLTPAQRAPVPLRA